MWCRHLHILEVPVQRFFFFFNALLHLIKFPGHSGIGNVKLKRVFAMSFPSEFSIQHMTKSVNFDAVICEILLDDNIAIW